MSNSHGELLPYHNPDNLGNPPGANPGFGRGENKLFDAVECYKLKLAGQSYAMIGDRYEVSPRRVAKLVGWYLDRHVAAQSAERERKIAHDRLEMLFRTLEPGLLVGYVPSVLAGVRIVKEIRDLYKIDVGAQDAGKEEEQDAVSGELRDMLSSARAKLALGGGKPAASDTTPAVEPRMGRKTGTSG